MICEVWLVRLLWPACGSGASSQSGGRHGAPGPPLGYLKFVQRRLYKPGKLAICNFLWSICMEKIPPGVPVKCGVFSIHPSLAGPARNMQHKLEQPDGTNGFLIILIISGQSHKSGGGVWAGGGSVNTLGSLITHQMLAGWQVGPPHTATNTPHHPTPRSVPLSPTTEFCAGYTSYYQTGDFPFQYFV